MTHIILMSWRNVLRSRKSILIECYRDMANSLGKDIGNVQVLSELRDRVYAPTVDRDRIEKSERQFVRVFRLYYWWLTFWTGILPTVLWLTLFILDPQPFRRVEMVLFAVLIGFPVLSVLGFLLASLLSPLAIRTINHLAEVPNAAVQRPLPQEPDGDERPPNERLLGLLFLFFGCGVLYVGIYEPLAGARQRADFSLALAASAFTPLVIGHGLLRLILGNRTQSIIGSPQKPSATGWVITGVLIAIGFALMLWLFDELRKLGVPGA